MGKLMRSILSLDNKNQHSPIWQLFVSPSAVTGGGRTFKCPNCGTEFEVELKLKENIK